MARTWTIVEARFAVLTATHELDVPAITADQYRAWRASQPNPRRWPAVNTVRRAADNYGTVAFHAPTGQDGVGMPCWPERRIRDSVMASGATGAIDYKSWRARQRNPEAHPAWSVVYRRGMSGLIDVNRRAIRLAPERSNRR